MSHIPSQRVIAAWVGLASKSRVNPQPASGTHWQTLVEERSQSSAPNSVWKSAPLFTGVRRGTCWLADSKQNLPELNQARQGSALHLGECLIPNRSSHTHIFLLIYLSPHLLNLKSLNSLKLWAKFCASAHFPIGFCFSRLSMI